MNKNTLISGFLALLLLLASCASKKDFVYLNDMVENQEYLFNSQYEAVVHKNDRLNITVTCKSPELAIPFNLYSNSVQVGADGNINTASSGASNAQKGYRVDVNGYIDFPILGQLHVEGKKVSEVTQLIRDLIVEGNYIKDPKVSLEFLNFKYTVLGAVGNTGTYSVTDDRITLLEAIANAGDLTPRARLDRVAVIREVDGHRKIYMHDVRSTDIFQSPCFYLQQNDIVYAEPKYHKRDRTERNLQLITLLISLAGLATSIVWAVRK